MPTSFLPKVLASFEAKGTMSRVGARPTKFTMLSSCPSLKYSLSMYGIIPPSSMKAMSMNSEVAMSPVRPRFVAIAPRVWPGPPAAPWTSAAW